MIDSERFEIRILDSTEAVFDGKRFVIKRAEEFGASIKAIVTEPNYVRFKSHKKRKKGRSY